MPARWLVVVFVVLAAAAGAGWMIGASSRSLVEQERHRAEMRAEFADARAQVLGGRVALFESEFGTAVERFQRARDRIGQVQRRLREIGQPDQAGRLEIAISHLSDAQHFAASFDSRAQSAAEEAMKTLDAAGGASTERRD